MPHTYTPDEEREHMQMTRDVLKDHDKLLLLILCTSEPNMQSGTYGCDQDTEGAHLVGTEGAYHVGKTRVTWGVTCLKPDPGPHETHIGGACGLCCHVQDIIEMEELIRDTHHIVPEGTTEKAHIRALIEAMLFSEPIPKQSVRDEYDKLGEAKRRSQISTQDINQAVASLMLQMNYDYVDRVKRFETYWNNSSGEEQETMSRKRIILEHYLFKTLPIPR
jgi:hypothetical protein